MRMIGAPDLANELGISYRQLDWWIRRGLVAVADDGGGGSGSRRLINRADIPALKACAAVSKALGRSHAGLTVELLVQVRDHYSEGSVSLDHGITLSWPAFDPSITSIIRDSELNRTNRFQYLGKLP